ncbi:MAG: hypothetical protein R2860_16125 [Desulfobacterales bacterium]
MREIVVYTALTASCLPQCVLRDRGCLAVRSADPSKQFEKCLMSGGFHLSRFRVPAYKGSKSESRFIWVASRGQKNACPGGGTLTTKRNRKKHALNLACRSVD